MILAWLRNTEAGDRARGELLAIIERNPGIHKSELARKTGMSWGAVCHHIQVLKRGGQIVIDVQGRRYTLYPAGTPPENLRYLSAFREEDVTSIMQRVASSPGIGIQELSKQAQLSRKVIRRHLSHLEDMGLVARTEDYRPRFYIRSDALDALQSMRNTVQVVEAPPPPPVAAPPERAIGNVSSP